MSEKRKGGRGEILPEANEGPPDSSHPSGLCPRCGKQSAFGTIGSLPVTFNYERYIANKGGPSSPEIIDQVTVLLCSNCKHGVAVVEEKYAGTRSADSPGRPIRFRGLHWWPIPGAVIPADVPPAIGSAFQEAAIALSAGCPRAAAVMARRALEAIATDQGIPDGLLVNRIKELEKRGKLLPTLAEWSQELRLVGNVGAHFDPIVDVALEDSKQLVSFLRELLRFIYELPAELKRRKGARETKPPASEST